jgi:hypothetical protein
MEEAADGDDPEYNGDDDTKQNARKGGNEVPKDQFKPNSEKKHSNEEVKKTTDTTKAPATESLAMLQRWVCLLVLWSRPACHILQAGVREGKEG